ncbi:lipopolysaccharide biosynthesis protein [Halarchaeum sp. P4]|uniref:lipopolysaccharide biosynthesis protein n=1 Tax=Halarchaeum sp. P4 TaxID=3421639 RepID=UPI003EBB2A64
MSSDEPPDDVDARLDDALERVAHGATVSVPGILCSRVLTVAFTAVLTNGFTPAAYGVFALTRRLADFLRALALGFRSGLSRFLPTAEGEERDAYVSVAVVVLLAVAAVFGVALFVAAPAITTYTGHGARFEVLLRVFALALPATVWLFTVTELLRALEAVGPLTLTLRVAYPLAQLLVGVVGAFVLHSLVAVAVGVVLVMGLTGLVAAAWAARAHGLQPRLRGAVVERVARRYLEFTVPLFFGGIATTVQRLGFYPLAAVLLTSVAAGVFTVGVVVGTLVRLPLMAINQFIPPVVAALNEEGHHESLKRLYHVTSRLVLVGVTGLAVPAVVYRHAIMGVFGAAYTAYAVLLPGFVLAQYAACAAGSVGILLTMTDNQRALLVVNVAVTLVLVATAIPLTAVYGLAGLVASYLLMLSLNNGAEVAVLYHLEGLQPFTRRHAFPFVAAVPYVALALAASLVLPRGVDALVGTALGLLAYVLVLRHLGFTPAEHRLAATLRERYRAALVDRHE